MSWPHAEGKAGTCHTDKTVEQEGEKVGGREPMRTAPMLKKNSNTQEKDHSK